MEENELTHQDYFELLVSSNTNNTVDQVFPNYLGLVELYIRGKGDGRMSVAECNLSVQGTKAVAG
jgi:hypothetical protein